MIVGIPRGLWGSRPTFKSEKGHASKRCWRHSDWVATGSQLCHAGAPILGTKHHNCKIEDGFEHAQRRPSAAAEHLPLHCTCGRT